jgi:hypothetical protein
MIFFVMPIRSLVLQAMRDVTASALYRFRRLIVTALHIGGCSALFW